MSDLLRGITLDLRGTLTFEGEATFAPCAGTLTIRPVRRLATLTYNLRCVDDRGRALSLHGEKHARLLHLPRTMTTLHTRVTREDKLWAEGTLRFDLRTLWAWVRSFRRGHADGGVGVEVAAP